MHIHSLKLSFFGTRGFADLSNGVDNGEFVALSETTMWLRVFLYIAIFLFT